MTDTPPVPLAEHCLGQVRWNGPTLEQLWEVQDAASSDQGAGGPVTYTQQWRAVPQIQTS